MRVRFLLAEALPTGGLSLATFRLARALEEAGHDVGVLFLRGDAPPGLRSLARHEPNLGSAVGLTRRLEGSEPDIILVCEDAPDWLEVAASVAPTAMHAHMHWGMCADSSRYWNRLHRPCAIRPGWRCTAVRPILGCSSFRRTLDVSHVARQVRLRELLANGTTGVVCVSSDQSEIYEAYGVRASHLAVIPNLGIRMSSDELRRAADAIPEPWRAAVAYFGRLTKAKGATLLPQIADALAGRAPLRIFGEGYMMSRLEGLPAGSLCGPVSQAAVAGVLMWARAVVFPSLWPEPGGIVGIDAQIIGTPLAAFDVGAARFWPNAERFQQGALEDMAAWLLEQVGPVRERDPGEVAEQQARYWGRVAEHASNVLTDFARGGAFSDRRVAPAETLMDITAELPRLGTADTAS